MARPKAKTLTPAERRVMEVIWKRGPSTVRQVADALKGPRAPAYTTVLTVLRVLADKGYVAAREAGRAHVFSALVSRTSARRRALKQLISEFFGSSPEALALHLVAEELDAEERARIEALIAERERHG
jgi:predicted transcriptional regulator